MHRRAGSFPQRVFPPAGGPDILLSQAALERRSGPGRPLQVRRRAMAAKTKFAGSYTAVVTPFKNGALDEAAFRALVNWQIDEGSHGLVPVGTTGESPTLNHEEHHKVVEWCIEEAKGRVPVIAGAGSNSTREAVSLARHAEKAGADAVLAATPYYTKPTQDGM